MRTRALILLTAVSLLPTARALWPATAFAAPVAPSAPPLDPRDDRIQRRAIRGGPVDLSQESQELRELREFEQATFPRAGMRPATPADGPVPGLGAVPGRDDEGRGG